MIITIPEIKKEFDKWNGIIFNNELPTPAFELMQTKRLLGQFRWRKIGANKKGYTIRISVFYDRPFESYVDTIVHEMLHFYIRFKEIKDTSSHGKIWKQKAAEISNKYGLTITRTSSPGGGVSDAVMEKQSNKKVSKFEYVFVCKIKGRYGATVVPSTKVHKFIPMFKNWKAIESFKVVKAPWCQTFTLKHARTACSVRFVTKETYDELLRNKVLEY